MNTLEYINFMENKKKELTNKVTGFNEREIVKTIEEEINLYENKRNNRIFLFHGLRGIGKSTALYQIIKRYKYKPMFIEGTSFSYENLDLLETIKEYSLISNSNILIIDEVNSITNWGKALKTINDLFNLKIIATGSSAIKISNGKNEINRRTKFISLNPLNFKEYLKIFHNKEIDFKFSTMDLINYERKVITLKKINNKILTKIPKIKNYFKKYLEEGFLLNNIFTCEETSEYILDKIVSDDLPNIDGFNVNTINKSKRMIYSLALSLPGTTSLDKLSNSGNTSKTTASSVMSAYNIASLIIETLPNKQGSTKFRKEPKYLFTSPAIRYGFMKKYSQTINIGPLREDAVVSHLLYNNIKIEYIQENKKTPDYSLYLKDKKISIEVGSENKKLNQLKKGIYILDNDTVEIQKDTLIMPLYLFCLLK